MKRLFLTISAVVLTWSSCYAQSGWFAQTSDTSQNLFSLDFKGTQLGWACGDSGIILRTTNGGNSWVRQVSGTNLRLTSIEFADAMTGWALGGDPFSTPLCNNYNVLLKTTNGGINWITQISTTIYLLTDLCVTNSQSAFTSNAGICCPPFCIVSVGGIHATTNAGANWFYTYGRASHSIFFLDSVNGWASSVEQSDVPPGLSFVLRTTNRGVNWQEIRIDTTNYVSKHLQFLDLNVGYLIRDALYRTTDGGNTWMAMNRLVTNNSRNLFFVNPDTGWCAGITGIIRTNDGGANWIQQTNFGGVFSALHFEDKNIGWAVGRSGIIYKTVTGGLTSLETSSERISSFELFQNYPNPFNPSTSIEFAISRSGDVSLVVYSLDGKEVRTLVNEELSAGRHTVRFEADNIPSGVYLYKLVTGNSSVTKRMVLIR